MCSCEDTPLTLLCNYLSKTASRRGTNTTINTEPAITESTHTNRAITESTHTVRTDTGVEKQVRNRHGTGQGQRQNRVIDRHKTINEAVGNRAGELTNIGEVINR